MNDIDFFVTSIPHTGTYFVRDSLLANQNAVAEHFWNANLAHCIGMMAKYKTIIPLRHPLNVARSWKSKGRYLPYLYDLWGEIVTDLDQFEPAYLPLDSPSRDGYLQDLNRRFDTMFSTDWDVLRGGEKTVRVPLTDQETNDVVEMMVDMSHFFNRFYKDWPNE